ncbi:MAG TPA: FtsX-like permease family protein [Sphingomicrobium sp.]|nr:FtsX-like permease family protein [Sphingomicrobium sp.]
MILDRILGSDPEARLLPAEKLHGPTVAVMAIMTFAMVVVAAAGLALANAASLVASGVENRYVIELPAGSRANLPRAVEVARSLPGVRSATPVPESDMRRTLERWLGEAASSAELPVPSLVTLELAPGADAGAIGARIGEQLPEARFVAETAELKPLLGSVRALQWLALSLVALMAAATAASIVLAARGALDTHRSTVEIMHGIGATDAQLVRLFERKIAVDAIAGAVVGVLAALLVLALAGGGGAAIAGELAGTAPLRPVDLLMLALVPVAAVAIAVLAARSTLLRALRETL